MSRSYEHLPGPTSFYGVRNAAAFIRRPLDFLQGLFEAHGGIVRAELLGQKSVFLYDPELIEQVLVRNAKKLRRDDYTIVLKRTLGEGLLTSEGDLWRQQRKLIAQAFSPRRIASYAETMVQVTDVGLPWGDGDVINLHAEMSRLTMEVVARVLFGAGIDEDEAALVQTAMETVNAFYANSLEAVFRIPADVPTPRNRSLRKAVRQIDSIVYRIIGERRRSDVRRDDLLDTLLAACDEEGAAMSDQQLRDEVITLFLAGHETTSLALSHTLYLLSRHPAVEATLVCELDDQLEGRLPAYEDVKRLVFTDGVVKEGMRIYPPAWTTGREVASPIVVGDVELEAGTQIMIPMWVIHRDSKWFADPEAFDPSRWQKPAIKELPRFAYFPFGGGPRVCVGGYFATLEATLLLSMIVQRFHLELLPGQTLAFDPSVTLRQRGPGLRMRVHRRKPKPATATPISVAS